MRCGQILLIITLGLTCGAWAQTGRGTAAQQSGAPGGAAGRGAAAQQAGAPGSVAGRGRGGGSATINFYDYDSTASSGMVIQEEPVAETHQKISVNGEALATTLSALLYGFVFRPELQRLNAEAKSSGRAEASEGPIPLWVTLGHLLFMVLAVVHAHHPAYLILGFLFFLAFTEVTEDFQRNFSLRPPVLVGFFLAGLVIHGGLQKWWIGPVLSRLSEVPLLLCAAALTAFNDNAAITYLGTLVPNLTDSMKYALVAGAVVGGGLTVIANAPNPAGQSILGRFFPNGVGPLGLFLGALPATIIMILCFLFAR